MDKIILINLCGPPAAGKSLVAKRFCSEHSNFEYHSIDNYRRKYQEENAWYTLMKALVNMPQHGIVESSGLSWRLHKLILDHPTIEKRGVITIFFHGNEDDFHERLNARQKGQEKEEVPFQYTNLDEHSLITYCLDNFASKYNHFIGILCDNSATPEAVYKAFEKIILERSNS